MVFNQYETWLIRGVCWDCILAVACISFMLEHCSREIDARRHFLQRFSTLCLWREIAPSRPEQGSREQWNKLLRSSELLWSSNALRRVFASWLVHKTHQNADYYWELKLCELVSTLLSLPTFTICISNEKVSYVIFPWHDGTKLHTCPCCSSAVWTLLAAQNKRFLLRKFSNFCQNSWYF